MSAQLNLGDCLDIMKSIPDGSVDMVLCDLPYGTTACKWDSIVPPPELWEQYKRVTKPSAAIVLTSAQPFSSAMVMSNPEMFRYEWIWKKTKKTGFLNARKQPLRNHEQILVFYRQQCSYFPQGVMPCSIECDRGSPEGTGDNYGNANPRYTQTQTGYPSTVLELKSEGKTVHPTQKPVALMEYLIRTYTNEGDTVLDNCMGSGTTGVACALTGRNFIGIEKDQKYFVIAEQRIKAAEQADAGSELSSFLPLPATLEFPTLQAV